MRLVDDNLERKQTEATLAVRSPDCGLRAKCADQVIECAQKEVDRAFPSERVNVWRVHKVPSERIEHNVSVNTIRVRSSEQDQLRSFRFEITLYDSL